MLKPAELQLTQDWDKTFPKSNRVDHKKVTFINRYGITPGGGPVRAQGRPGQTARRGRLRPLRGGEGAVLRPLRPDAGGTGLPHHRFRPLLYRRERPEPPVHRSPDINTEDFQAAVDYLSVQDGVDPERIGILGICGWGGLALNTAAIDTRIKATVVSTMYDMSRIAAKGYFDEADREEARHQVRESYSAARTAIYRSGDYGRVGGCMPLPVPEDVPFYVKDYSEYYKGRAYHARSLNSNEGWNTVGTLSFLNQPILQYSNEIRSAVLILHGEKAHSCYMGRDAYARMMKGNPKPENKELMILPGAVHTVCMTI